MRNMTQAAEAGATISMDSFFLQSSTGPEEMARRLVYRVLVEMGLPQLTRLRSQLIKRWLEGAI
jgi:3-polyprenyl-4-hydroxybenzoate decarboxylase